MPPTFSSNQNTAPIKKDLRYRIKRKPKVIIINLLDDIMADWQEVVAGIVVDKKASVFHRLRWETRRE